uniref:Uncharacterized protein n=1 Tax=Arundo donax TaxID=35708 RepID=A0A0A9HNI6_ARUDO
MFILKKFLQKTIQNRKIREGSKHLKTFYGDRYRIRQLLNKIGICHSSIFQAPAEECCSRFMRGNMCPTSPHIKHSYENKVSFLPGTGCR